MEQELKQPQQDSETAVVSGGVSPTVSATTPPETTPSQQQDIPPATQGVSQQPVSQQFLTGSSLNSLNIKDSDDNLVSGSKSGLFSLVGGAGSVLILVVFIFASKSILGLVGGEGAFIIQLLVVAILSIAGVVFGYLNQSSKDRNGLGAVGLALASVMLVLAVILTSYYLKIKIELNSYKSKYNSSSYSR